MQARIRLIIESQPRSGTHYTINNLLKVLGLEYATVFEGEQESDKHYFAHGAFRQGDLFCAAPDPSRHYHGHLVKSHFFHKVQGQDGQTPVLYLLSYFYDSYYSFGWILTDMKSKPYAEYVLRADSPEWEKLLAFMPEHLAWLDALENKRGQVVRYEDYATSFAAAIAKLQGLIGEFDPAGFAPFKPKAARGYFSGSYAGQMDAEVFTALQKTFKDYIRVWYPERADA